MLLGRLLPEVQASLTRRHISCEQSLLMETALEDPKVNGDPCLHGAYSFNQVNTFAFHYSIRQTVSGGGAPFTPGLRPREVK